MTQQLTEQQQNMADHIADIKLRRQNRKRETAIGSTPAAPFAAQQEARVVQLQTEQVARREEHAPFLEEVEAYITVVRKRMAKNPIPSDLDKTKPEIALNTARRLLKKSELDISAAYKFKACVTDLKWFMGKGIKFSDVTRPMTAGQGLFLKKLGVKSDTTLTIAEADKQIKALMGEQMGDAVQQSVSKLRRDAEVKEDRAVSSKQSNLALTLSACIELSEFPTYYFDPRSFRILNHYGKPMKVESDPSGVPRYRLRDAAGKRKWLTTAKAFHMAGGDNIC